MFEELIFNIKDASKEYQKALEQYYLGYYKVDFIVNILLTVLGFILWFYLSIKLVAGFIVGFCVMYLFYIYLFQYKFAALYLIRAKKILNDTTLIISKDCIQSKNDITESKQKWEFFYRALENVNYFYVFSKFGKYVIIPKKVFTNKEQQEWFRDILKNQVTNDIRII